MTAAIRSLIVTLAASLSITSAIAADEHPPVEPLAEALIDGLRTGSFQTFVESHTATLEDLKNAATDKTFGDQYANVPEEWRPKKLSDEQINAQVKHSSTTLAGSLEKIQSKLDGINFSGESTTISVASISKNGMSQYANPTTLSPIPMFSNITITLKVETDQATPKGTNISGDYEFVADRCIALPTSGG